MFKRLPPLNSLRGFETAARLGSFHKAAAELNLTQSAISQQIRGLEIYLGQPLFFRNGRTISLSDAGHDLLSTTRTLMQQLAAGIRRLDQYAKPNQLIVNTTPAFARHWLLPRLPVFQERHPEVDLWLITTFSSPVMATEEIDIAIRDDLFAQSECKFEMLCGDQLFPACHPTLLALPHQQRATLHGERHMDWSHWAVGGGNDVGQKDNGTNFSDPGMLQDAASTGLGIALVSELLSRMAIRDNHLQQLSERRIHGPDWVSLVHHDSEKRPSTRLFHDWIHVQLAQTEGLEGRHPQKTSASLPA